MSASSSPTLDVSARLALGACIALVALGLGWELWWAPTGRGTLALKVLPLVAALPGLWRRRLYTYRWLSLALWAYVAEGCVRGASDLGAGRWLGWSEALLGVLLFVGCAWQVRAQLAARRAVPTPSPA
jgi:uncharacterized membrane protein